MARLDKGGNERTHLNREQLLFLREIVEEKTGLYLADDRLEELAVAYEAVLRELPGCNSLALWRSITNSSLPAHPYLYRFILHLTVGETYFFRCAPDFSALREHVLPALIQRRASTSRHLRIWSMACSTGEEPYSLAIMVKDLIGDLSDWNVHILGTDIDSRALEKAKGGTFGRWSFRGVPDEIQSRCFAKSEDAFVLKPEYREMVVFRQLNLLDRNWPSVETSTERMDLVLCRNVLIYFRSPTIVDISNRIFDALAPDGILMVSHTEHGSDLHPRFQKVILPETIVYSKESPKPREEVSSICRTVDRKAAPLPSLFPEGGNSETVRVESAADSPISTDALNPKTQLMEANAQFAAKNYGAAVRCLLRSGAETGDHYEASLLLARSYANLGLLEEGAEWCSRAVKLNPLDVESRHLLAILKINIGRIQEAIPDLRSAIFLDPGLIIAFYELGNCLKATGHCQQAVKAYEAAKQLSGGMADGDPIPFSDGLVAGQLRRVVQRGLQACANAEE